MHTDVELGDSPSRQHVSEDELSRRLAIMIFLTQSCTLRLPLSTIHSTRSYKDEPVNFPVAALALQVIHCHQHLHSTLAASKGRHFPSHASWITLHRRQSLSTEMTQCGDCSRSRKLLQASCSFSTRGTARMRGKTCSHAGHTVHRHQAILTRICFSPYRRKTYQCSPSSLIHQPSTNVLTVVTIQ
jgi:hypothetical protein